MKSDLSIKELQKGYDAFRKIHDESTDKLNVLEKNLLEEVRTKGCTDYSKNLSSSIHLETQHVVNAKREMEEYREEIWKKEEDVRINDEYSRYINYHAINMHVEPRADVSYIAPQDTAINKFIKIVQDHSVTGYETANWVRTHKSIGGNDESAQRLRENQGCVLIVVKDRVIKTINIKTGEAINVIPEKNWFK